MQVTMPYICPTAMRKNLSYTRDYILIANFIGEDGMEKQKNKANIAREELSLSYLPGMALIPFVILAVLNFKLYRKIKVQPDTFISNI